MVVRFVMLKTSERLDGICECSIENIIVIYNKNITVRGVLVVETYDC